MTTYRKYLDPIPSVVVFDPSLATRNVGDEIIADAAHTELTALMPHMFKAVLPTHERLGPRSWRFCRQAAQRFVAGSNILSDRLPFDRQWRIRPRDMAMIKDLTLLGVGWRSYKDRPRPWATQVFRRLLSPHVQHSVRDEMTKHQLAERGVENVLNTGCVTMWRLDTNQLARLACRPKRRVVTTINAGHSSSSCLEILDLLLSEYEEVLLWPQGIDDVRLADHFSELRPRLSRVAPTLAAYDQVLSAGDADFVGNRLHGGIRALQSNQRALIISIDNRAAEIAKDTGLPTVDLQRDGLSGLRQQIRKPQTIELRLPFAAIDEWRSQFAQAGAVPLGECA